jgi:hypothetical protein
VTCSVKGQRWAERLNTDQARLAAALCQRH